MNQDFMNELYGLVQSRPFPEDVADCILVNCKGELSKEQKEVLDGAASIP